MPVTVRTDGLYCAYLRKSRRDVELELQGGEDTLTRHERELRALAQRLGITIAQTYREVVSGDTIADRPEVQRLLEGVNASAWDGVLVVDIDRLGRGDSIDQGVIMQSFAYSRTLIITPGKIYDPGEETDEESVEVHFDDAGIRDAAFDGGAERVGRIRFQAVQLGRLDGQGDGS